MAAPNVGVLKVRPSGAAGAPVDVYFEQIDETGMPAILPSDRAAGDFRRRSSG